MKSRFIILFLFIWMLYITCMASFYMGALSVYSRVWSLLPVGMFSIPQVRCVYLQARSVHPRVQLVTRHPREIPSCLWFFYTQELISYLQELIFIATRILTRGSNFYPMNTDFYHGNRCLASRNWERATNNLTAVIEVALIDALLILKISLLFSDWEPIIHMYIFSKFHISLVYVLQMLSSLNIVVPIYQLLLMFDIGVSSFLEPEKLNKKSSDATDADGSSPVMETPEMGMWKLQLFYPYIILQFIIIESCLWSPWQIKLNECNLNLF